MNRKKRLAQRGSVLIIAMMTITILTMICATSLYIATQNTGASMQTSGWQQALTGAESGIDAAIRALNQNSTSGANAWTNWRTVSTATLPTTEPASGTGNAATTVPTSSQYNYLPSSRITTTLPQSEGATSISAWTTIDTAGGLSDSSGNWYRIRSTGETIYPTNSTILSRVSNNRLDNDLRNTIAMHFSRRGGSYTGPTRTIEVIVNPVGSGGGAHGLTLANWLVMSGSGTADAFSSPTGVWSSAYRDLTYPLLVAEGATSNQAKFASNSQAFVYGGMVYSGNPPQNTNSTTVKGQVSTPDNISIPTPVDPTQVNTNNISWSYQNPWTGTTTSYAWTSNGGGGGSGTFPAAAGTYATLTGGGGLPTNSGIPVNSITATGTASQPELIIINGDFTVSGSNTFTVNATTTGSPPTASSANSYVTIWVKGKFTTSGSSIVTMANGTHVQWIVDSDITFSGSSFNNGSSTAANDSFVGIGNIKVTDSGSAAISATVNAPGATGTISGSGDWTGAFVASNLTISGSGSFHYDESLNSGGGNPTIGNYAFASWFEDNSDPSRNAIDTSGANHPIVY